MMSRLLHPVRAIIGVLVLIVLAAISATWSPLKRAESDFLESFFNSGALQLSSLGSILSEDSQVFENLRDRWGLVYPHSHKVSFEKKYLDTHQRLLNDGLQLLDRGETAAAERAFRVHNYYPGKILGRRGSAAESLPDSAEPLACYGLFRYNRAVALLENATHLEIQDRNLALMLKRALYDLRRATAAFERLGSPLSDQPGGYWQDGRTSWEGHRLSENHSGLSFEQTYGNLSMAYLRLADRSGYPYVELNYLEGEMGKYRHANSILSRLVSHSVEQVKIFKGDGAEKRHFYRLVMGLQNLEVASRGLDGWGDPLFQYQIGLTLSHLRPLAPSISAEDVSSFLQLATQGTPGSGFGKAILRARKELALLYLSLGDGSMAHQWLMQLEPTALAAVFNGPYQRQEMLFTDLARYQWLVQGQLAKAMKHRAMRFQEVARLEDPSLNEWLQKIDTALWRSYGRGLRRQALAWADQGRPHHGGALIAEVLNDPGIRADQEVFGILQNETASLLNQQPTLWLSVQLHLNPDWHRWIGLLPLLLLFSAFCYGAWVYLMHAHVARKMLTSAYGRELLEP